MLRASERIKKFSAVRHIFIDTQAIAEQCVPQVTAADVESVFSAARPNADILRALVATYIQTEYAKPADRALGFSLLAQISQEARVARVAVERNMPRVKPIP